MAKDDALTLLRFLHATAQRRAAAVQSAAGAVITDAVLIADAEALALNLGILGIEAGAELDFAVYRDALRPAALVGWDLGADVCQWVADSIPDED